MIARVCMLVFPLLLAVPLSIELPNLKRDIFPALGFGNRVQLYTDNGWKGNSTIDKFHVDKTMLTLEYMLREGTQYPMVFILILLDVSGKACDLSQYDRVLIRIREATNSRILIFIKTFMPGMSRSGSENVMTLRHNEYTLILNQGVHEYDIELNEFVTSQWWLDDRNINPDNIPEEKYNRVISFDMQFNTRGSDYVIGKPEKISIERISFKRSPGLLAIVSVCIMCLYYVGYGALAFRTRSLRKVAARPLILGQQPLDVTNFRDEQLLKIKTFLEVHYRDPDISTRIVYAELGIPPARVFTLLKEVFDLTFKEIINKMRIEEAKQLLLESDLRITEIAMKLGFGQHSYFNRLFKKHEGVTPSEYRDRSS
jgi:AraC-like DNA-binding protein